jgi:hypothetical protein
LKPVVSNSLFSLTDIFVESNDTKDSRARTAESGYPLFTVVDRSGLFSMEVIFCVCPDVGNTDAQLLRAGLFPASFKQTETLFTVSILDDFLTDNLECKTMAQQYYSKLQSMTSKTFPNNIPVMSCCIPIGISHTILQNRYRQLLRASRQWQDLKNQKESGVRYMSKGEPIPDGSMAIFCPACPQPSINLPMDWQTKYTPYIILLTSL